VRADVEVQHNQMKVAFDIGGVISRYPREFRDLMAIVGQGGGEVFVLTDMNQTDAWSAIQENGLAGLVYRENILSADWSKHGDLCKTKVCEEHGIDILIDDRPDYVAKGNFIGLVLSPRPDVPYYAEEWVNKSTPAVCVPPEEYEEFKKWRAAKPVTGIPG
jgi:hypothetical protein